MRLQILVGLILCNLIWSAHPLMGKLLLDDFTPDQAAWFRYASGLLAFWAFLVFRWVRSSRAEVQVAKKMKMADMAWVSFLGGMAFCISPLLQLHGLETSNATDNALIVAMEPLLTVALAWIFLKQRVSSNYVFCFILSLVGFVLLAGLSLNGLQFEKSHFTGNILMFLALFGEATYSTVAGKLVRTYSSERIYGGAILAGVILLTLSVWFLTGQNPIDLVRAFVTHVHWRSAGALLWIGPLGSTVTYLFWIVALREATVASMALTLFIQPVTGALWGYIFLRERLTSLQAMGGALILGAVVMQGLWGLPYFKRWQKSPPPPSVIDEKKPTIFWRFYKY